MQKDAIRFLIGQYMKQELTALQQAELLQLLDRHEESELVDVVREMMEADSVNNTSVDAATMQATLQRVLSTDKTIEPAAPARVVTMRRSWQWVAAAACLLLAGAGSYVWLNKKQPAPATLAAGTYTSDVQPGGNKAVLTLGNGKQLVLDSAGNGLLAQEGNAQVTKEGAGLKYEAATAQPPSAVTYNTLTTPKGGEYKVMLPDGSRVWLNAASSLRFPTAFTGNTRDVELEGEGYFEIAKNAAKPFHVKTTHQQIEVLGTHFNVNAYGDEATTKTTLVEGKVKVNPAIVNRESAIGNPRQVGAGFQSAILKPGEQAIVVANPFTTEAADSRHPDKVGNSPLTIDHSPDMESVLAWTNGRFQFREQHIEEIMKQISRWYNVEVAYAGKTTREGFTATIPRNVPVSKVLRYLELTTLVHFKIEGNRITVLP